MVDRGHRHVESSEPRAPRLGAWVVRVTVLVTGLVALLVVVGLLRVAIDEPLVLLIAGPLLAVVAFGALQLWRLGVYESADGIVVQRITGRRVLPWDHLQAARVEDVTVGFRSQRAVWSLRRG